ncbi:hypothetical protein TOL_1942 [Thalassolituus oleivorans MIL-1]|uniref:Uncharacterized protein n=1 Tax=Thalassolituus oleivorans MIL-1 TaxID=1298593 RepID=M5DQZ2_9GAMM|nr:hypothetical protein TOL_1942 [Thalassolituus oleivorans MIL-1]
MRETPDPRVESWSASPIDLLSRSKFKNLSAKVLGFFYVTEFESWSAFGALQIDDYYRNAPCAA